MFSLYFCYLLFKVNKSSPYSKFLDMQSFNIIKCGPFCWEKILVFIVNFKLMNIVGGVNFSANISLTISILSALIMEYVVFGHLASVCAVDFSRTWNLLLAECIPRNCSYCEILYTSLQMQIYVRNEKGINLGTSDS